MKKILVLAIITFIGFDTNAQLVQLDSTISYRDTLSEMPFIKRIYQYNNEGTHTKTIGWNTTSSNGIVMYGLTQKDSFYYNEQGLLDRMSVFGLNNGVYTESIRTILEYDDDGNNTKYRSQGKIGVDNEWYDLWVWTNTFENGLYVGSIFSFNNPDTGMMDRLNREEYIYDPITERLTQVNGFDYDSVTSEEYPTTRRNWFYDTDGFLVRTEGYSYNESSSEFDLNSIAIHMNDEFGNNLSRTSMRIDSSGEETLSSRTTNVFNTNIEKSQAYLPYSSSVQFRSDKHIMLHSTTESWEDEEWKVNGRKVYYYSSTTSTNDLFTFESLNFYPNPTVSTLHFHNNLLTENAKVIQIIDNNGTIHYSEKQKENQINIERLPTGLYHVILKDGNSIFKGDFIKI